MSAPPNPVVRQPTDAQRRAADPTRSVWVTANAGTGKTRVLTDRILRLLLAGADPEGILAITFTKAAAAEMTQRIEERLASWATLDGGALAADLEALLGRPAEARETALARTLLARVLDLPQGIPIATIHAFAQGLLRRFPLEAGIAPHFVAIDERDAAELQREASARVLAAAAADPGPLGRAVAELAVWLADQSIGELIGELLAERVRLLRAREACGGADELLAAIARALDAEPGLPPGRVRERACEDGVFDAERLARAARLLAEGGARDVERGRRIAAWLSAAPADRLRLFDEYRRAFLGSEGAPLQERSLASKAVAERHPEVLQTLVREQGRLLEVGDRERRQMVLAKTEAALRLAFAVLDAYESLKAHRAALDFDDLIEHARRLLSDAGQRAWVLYRLDARIDHVLVDEAQDTSPAQWEIVERLTEEFFAGQGARESPRSLFVVGDEKQSIYRFQGADLAHFRAVRERIRARAEAARTPLAVTLLDRSFRSVPAILELVDAVFADPVAREGVAEAPLHHESERGGERGIVELWPLAAAPPAEADPQEPWALPDAPNTAPEPEQLVAEAIAREIARWVREGEPLPASGRPTRPGDVLVLVSRRGTIQERIVRALRRCGIPVAGADRLALERHLAVADLLALGEVLLLPENDLALACLLKSPLLGLSEEALFELAHGRGPVSLIERLRGRAAADDEGGPFRTAYERLEEWLRRADFMPPFELYTWILGADGGRQRLLERLGREALDPIEAFLGQALAYERGHPASLQGFLSWFRLSAGELKRDPEKPGDMVRVSTVHGAKGLESPIVVLADAGPHGPPRRGRLIWGTAEGRLGPELPFWRSNNEDREPFTDRLVEHENRLEREENRRLLYVALTRAGERLVITGWHNRRSANASAEGRNARELDGSWHALVRRALEGLAGVVQEPGERLGPGFGGPILRYERGTPRTAADRPAPVGPLEPLPAWLRRPAPAEPRPPRPLAPSRVLPEPEPVAESVVGPVAARRRRFGILVHKALELLPELSAAARPAALDRFLARFARDLDPDEQARLRASVLGLLADPAFAQLFGPDARAEQAIVGVVGGQAVSGQIDRLVITDREILAVDLKTGRRPPGEPGRAFPGYVRQMALYRALLSQRWPERRVRCGLLWTESTRLEWLDEALLDATVAEGTPS